MGAGIKGGLSGGGMHRGPPPGSLGMAYRNNEPQAEQQAKNSPNLQLTAASTMVSIFFVFGFCCTFGFFLHHGCCCWKKKQDRRRILENLSNTENNEDIFVANGNPYLITQDPEVTERIGSGFSYQGVLAQLKEKNEMPPSYTQLKLPQMEWQPPPPSYEAVVLNAEAYEVVLNDLCVADKIPESEEEKVEVENSEKVEATEVNEVVQEINPPPFIDNNKVEN